MRQLGTIVTIKSDDGIVRLDIDVAGEFVRDVLVVSELRIQPDLAKGDRVLVEQLDGADAEWIATPYRLLTTTATWEIQVGDVRIIVTVGKVKIQNEGGIAVSLATNEELKQLYDLLKNWPVAATDGGAALQTAAGLLPDPTGTSILEAE